MTIDVSTVCLGILSLGDATGYEIKKLVEGDRYQLFVEASFGAIYPALARLNKDGLVDCRTESGNGRPDRKVYSINEAGRIAFANALKQDPGQDRFRSEFLFMMMFSGHLETSRISEVIDQRINELEKRIDELSERLDCATNPGQRFVVLSGLSVYRASIQHLKENRHLLEDVETPTPATNRAPAREIM